MIIVGVLNERIDLCLPIGDFIPAPALHTCIVSGDGNTESTITGEFNFSHDPEAAHMVLQNMTCPVKVLSWEPCLRNGFQWVMHVHTESYGFCLDYVVNSAIVNL